MGAAPTDSGSETRWISTSRTRNGPSFSEAFAGLGAVPNRADVDRIGIAPEGVTFVRAGESVTVPWTELVPSKLQWKGMLVLSTREGTPPRGGPWIVDAAQGKEILMDLRWSDPEYSRRVKWLT